MSVYVRECVCERGGRKLQDEWIEPKRRDRPRGYAGECKNKKNTQQ